MSKQEAVLVLNANYEPLNVCSVRRAIGLLVTGKAHVVLENGGYLRTVRARFPIPSVIRLQRLIRRPYPSLKISRKGVFRRDAYTCQYCGRKTPHLTVDHVIPLSRGGAFVWENVVTACYACNQRKGNRTPEEAGMRLLRPPRRPPNSALYRFGVYLERHKEWRPFLEGW